MTLVPRICQLLKAEGLTDVLVTWAGSSLTTTCRPSRRPGWARSSGPGTTIAEVADYFRANARPRE